MVERISLNSLQIQDPRAKLAQDRFVEIILDFVESVNRDIIVDREEGWDVTGTEGGKGPKFVGDLAKIQRSFTQPVKGGDEEAKTPSLLTKYRAGLKGFGQVW